MGSRIALKMMGSLSRATICRSRERHVVIEPPKAKRGKMLVWKLMKKKNNGKFKVRMMLKENAYLHHTASP